MRKFLTQKFLRRFGPAKHMTDAAIVGGAALKYAQRKGWITDSTANRFGSANSSGGEDLSIGEMMILGAAALRLAKSVLSRRNKDKKIIIDV